MSSAKYRTSMSTIDYIEFSGGRAQERCPAPEKQYEWSPANLLQTSTPPITPANNLLQSLLQSLQQTTSSNHSSKQPPPITPPNQHSRRAAGQRRNWNGPASPVARPPRPKRYESTRHKINTPTTTLPTVSSVSWRFCSASTCRTLFSSVNSCEEQFLSYHVPSVSC